MSDLDFMRLVRIAFVFAPPILYIANTIILRRSVFKAENGEFVWFVSLASGMLATMLEMLIIGFLYGVMIESNWGERWPYLG